MIRVVHPGSRILMLTFFHPGSRGQKGTQSRIPDPDPQHWFSVQAGDHWNNRGENLPQADIQAVPGQQGPQGSQTEKAIKGQFHELNIFLYVITWLKSPLERVTLDTFSTVPK